MIDQVVTNLLENAVKYTPVGSPILIDVRLTVGGVRVAVEDRGPGIPPELRERVFDKFYRLDTPARARGSGLGLAVARGLVEGHGGSIRVETGGGPPEAPGARFVFELPALEHLPAPAPASPRAGDPEYAIGRPVQASRERLP